MKKTYYKLFHGNLAFSAIPSEQLGEVIDKTYFPFLELVEKSKAKLALEISAYSLEIIKRLRPNWIKKFKSLYEIGLVELIGSGYMQIIGPLVPYEVNLKNQKLGKKVYKDILGITPKIAFINEQTYSDSMLDLSYEVGYEAIIMEWNNAYSINPRWKKEFSYAPVVLKGLKFTLPVIWSDSILFQQYQRYIHSEKNETEYFEFLDNYTNFHKVIPLYSSDLEIFNFRPGRFETEAVIEKDEWKRIENLLFKLLKKGSFKLPSEILQISKIDSKKLLYLTTNSHRIIVKKQDKYSLSRWAACGRGANLINTLCYNYYKTFSKESSNKDWKKLLKYWGSDYRTHITLDKWNEAISFLKKAKKEVPMQTFKQKEIKTSKYIKEKKGYLVFEKDRIRVLFNLKKGFTLDSVYIDKKNIPIGTIHHGELDLIQHGSDYYTGTTTIESVNTKKIANLQSIQDYKIEKSNIHEYSFSVKIKLNDDIVEKKVWTINCRDNTLSFYTKLKISEFIKGSIRLGTITLGKGFVNKNSYIKYKNGGNKFEKNYLLNNEINHHISKSIIQSSSSGIGVTNGKMKFYKNNKKLFTVEVNRISSYPFIMLQNNRDKRGYLTRIIFSVQEIDDTLKENNIKNFELKYKIKF